MKLYNTMSSKKEDFTPISPDEVLIYVCGPTVYNFFHIGNARAFITFDVLRRYFEYKNYKVRYVQNFTDIDDKMIKRANEEEITIKDVAEKYIAEYFTDACGLGINKATVHPRATENIDAIIDMVNTLINKNHAYESNGDVYFRVNSIQYGKLSKQNLDTLESGNRGQTTDVTELKENPADFALWKAAKPGEPKWQSPWGEGRPGWHIECSAMAKRFLGDTVDIHCGGVDLVFPHHENEIAQSEAANGAELSRYWLHNGFINIDNQKMSKSGNFFTVRDVANVFGYDIIRFFLLSAHYRSPLNYSEEILLQSKAGLMRIRTCVDSLKFRLTTDRGDKSEDISHIDSRRLAFESAMDDDLNTADAFAAVFDLVRDANNAMASERELSPEELNAYLDMFGKFDSVLGFLPRENNIIDEKIEELIAKRQEARKNKDFKAADAIRDELKCQGIILEDTPQGVRWKREI